MLRTFQAAVDDWEEVCAALGAWEAQHLATDDHEAAKEQHHQWVNELLCWGHLMQRATGQEQFPDKALAARVESRVRHLEDKLALWHREMGPEEEEHILKAAFP